MTDGFLTSTLSIESELALQELQRLQEQQRRHIDALSANGLDKSIKDVTVDILPAIIQATPILTGSWKASQTVDFSPGVGSVFVDPTIKNVKYDVRVIEYASFLTREKGGDYDVYGTFVKQQGKRVLGDLAELVMFEVENA